MSDPVPYRVRLDGAHVKPTVVQAIAALASEYPGDRPLVIDVAGTGRQVQLPHAVVVCTPFERALRQVVQAHATPDQ